MTPVGRLAHRRSRRRLWGRRTTTRRDGGLSPGGDRARRRGTGGRRAVAARRSPTATSAPAESTDTNWGAAALAIPAPSDQRERAVPSLMTRFLAVETLGWLRAIRLHVITGQAVEAFANEVRRHRPRLRRDNRTTPAAPAVHLPVTIGVRHSRHAGGVDDHGRESGRLRRPGRLGRRWSGMSATRVSHEAGVVGATTTPALAPGQTDLLPATRR